MLCLRVVWFESLLVKRPSSCCCFGVPHLQIGKSGASWITQAFLLGCGSIAAAMPFTGIIFAGVIITWIQATLSLHKQMQAVEKARLATQHAAAAAPATAQDAQPAAAAVLAPAMAAVSSGYNGDSTPEGSATSSMEAASDSDSSSTAGGNGHTNGHTNGHQLELAVPAGVQGDLHAAVRLSGGATYSPSVAPDGSSTTDGNGPNGSPLVRERAKVKMQ